MNRMFILMPWVLVGLCILNGMNAMDAYGKQWMWGRYGMPHSLTNADGRSYVDGTPVNPLQAILINGGFEEEFYLGACIFVTTVVFLVVREMRRTVVLKQKLAQLRADAAFYERLRNS